MPDCFRGGVRGGNLSTAGTKLSVFSSCTLLDAGTDFEVFGACFGTDSLAFGATGFLLGFVGAGFGIFLVCFGTDFFGFDTIGFLLGFDGAGFVGFDTDESFFDFLLLDFLLKLNLLRVFALGSGFTEDFLPKRDAVEDLEVLDLEV